MCGICGIIEKRSEVDKSILKKMNDSLYHRGPDDEGFYINKNVGLASRRLSIIDIQGGKQPIKNEDSTIITVFNGEIYNYVELREELERKGHSFKTKSDTEVIVHLYEEQGDDFVDFLNGMFAIALYDLKNQELILARDRAGEKPLYFGDFPDFFIFASELKAILNNPKVGKRLNLKAMNLYLMLEYVPSPFSVIEGVQKLKPGHILKYKGGEYSIKRYFTLTKIITPQTERNVIEKIDELISQSVKIRLRSDVDVGIFLSGGIDSSIITYYAVNHRRKIKTFNISFDDPSFDESKFARAVSDFLGTEHVEERFDQNKMLEIFPDVIKFIDEPFGDASILPTYLVSKLAREHVKVVLGGDGGDELFGGYPTYFAHKFMQIYRLFPFKNFVSFISNKLPVSHSNFSFDFKIKKFLEGQNLEGWERHIRWMGAFSREELKKIIIPYEESEISLEEFIAQTVSPEDPNNFFALDFKTYLAEDVLVKVDRASMMNSLEVRAPFLDPDLIIFAYSLPERFKVRNFKTKYILRELLRIKFFPKEIINRPKKGFGIPIAKWIKENLKNVMLEKFLQVRELFRREELENLLKEHIELRKDNRKKLWTLFVFLLWKENYIDSN